MSDHHLEATAIEPISPEQLEPGDELLQSSLWASLKQRFGWTPHAFRVPVGASSYTLLTLARARTSHASACANPIDAVEAALRRTKEGDIVLVAGSVYLAGAVLDGARRGEIWPRHGPDAKVG